MLPVLLPVYAFMTASIPMLDPASYSRLWLVGGRGFPLACGLILRIPASLESESYPCYSYFCR